MRTLLTLACCLLGSVALAEEPAATIDQPSAQSQPAKSPASDAAATTGATKADTSAAGMPTDMEDVELPQEQEVVPLHQHPTLVSMLKRNNAMRAALGLPPHRINPELTRAAQDHAWFMARTGQFSHESNLGPSGRARKYRYRGLVRENIAWNYRGVSSVFHGWQTSAGHWANIISPTVDAGFGYAIAADGSTYWVGMYGEK